MGKTYEALVRAEKEVKRQSNLDISKKTTANLPQVMPHPISVRPSADQYDELKMNLFTRQVHAPLKTLLFTGVGEGCGCSTTAVNFARALAKDKHLRVLLVDVNFRKPSIHRFFKMDPNEGMSELLGGDLDMNSKIRKIDSGNLSVIPSGDRFTEPLGLFGSERINRLFSEINGHFNYLILDGPPVPASSETRILCNKVDGVVLVLEAGKTRRQVAIRAKKQIEESGGEILGTVLNKRKHYIPEWLYRRL